MTEISIPQIEKLLIEIKNKFWKKTFLSKWLFKSLFSNDECQKGRKTFFCWKKSFLIAMPNFGGAKIRSVFILITFRKLRPFRGETVKSFCFGSLLSVFLFITFWVSFNSPQTSMVRTIISCSYQMG